MAIPRWILFLEESRSRGMANLHSSRIEEDEIYSSGSSGNFEEWVIQKITKNSWKCPKKFKRILKKIQTKFSIDFILQSWLIIPKTSRKSQKNLTNFWKFSEILIFKGNSVFSRSSLNFGEDSRSRGVINKTYSWGNQGVKKCLGPRGSRDEEFLVPSLFEILFHFLFDATG